MERRFDFVGKGGELVGKVIVGYLLTIITFFIYMSWFQVSLLRYIYSKTTFGPTMRGKVQFEFSGTGGQLFVKAFLGYLLCVLSFGIYGAWYIAGLSKFFADNSQGRAEDGTVFRLQLNVTGGQLFGTVFVGGLLTLITLGIYMPWFICKLQRIFAENTKILANNFEMGSTSFHGAGGELFGKMFVGAILSVLTLGIYGAWFQVNMVKFFMGNTQVVVDRKPFWGNFTGTGGQLFVKMLIGFIGSMVTLGIYSAWFMADLLDWGCTNSKFYEAQAQPQHQGYPQQQGYGQQPGYQQPPQGGYGQQGGGYQ